MLLQDVCSSPSVYPPLCLSHAGTKRSHISSKFFHHWVAPPF